jgi:glycosyltransferase involved in cell wall biosynthesis
MRVYFVNAYSMRAISGVSKVISQLCHGLKKRDIDHLVISSRQEDEMKKDQSINSIEIDVRKISNFRDLYQGLKIMRILLKKRKEYEIIHIHYPFLQATFSAFAGKILGKPVVVTIHGKFQSSPKILKRPILWAMLKGTVALADKITFVDEVAQKHYNIPSSLIIENGIDVTLNNPDPDARKNARKRLGLEEDEVVLLYLGRVMGHKGIYDVINSFSDLTVQSTVKLKMLIVGSGELEKVSKKIEELNLKEHVKIFGKQREVMDYYRASDIFVLFTSPFEGLPVTLLESSAFGLAIVSTNVAGISRLIENENNGLLLKYGDKKGLREVIKRLSEDKDLRIQLGMSARKRVVENHNIEKTVDRYVELYNNLLQSK